LLLRWRDFHAVERSPGFIVARRFGAAQAGKSREQATPAGKNRPPGAPGGNKATREQEIGASPEGKTSACAYEPYSLCSAM
jgi:hypothetical protein